MPRSSGTKPRPARARRSGDQPLISSPPSTIRPSISRWRPTRHRRVVVFPAPFLPTSVMSSPSSTRNATFFSAWAWPYHAERPATSSIHLAQVRGDDRRIVTDRLVRPIGDDPALLHDDDALRHFGDHAHVVFDEQYRATARDLPDQRDGPAHVLEAHPGRRLVQQEEARPARGGGRRREPAALPRGGDARGASGGPPQPHPSQ